MSSVVRYWNAREHLGRYFSTLFLDFYNHPPFEEVIKIFDDWLTQDSDPFVKLHVILYLFNQMCAKLSHFIDLSNLAFHSQYLQCDYFFPKNASLEFFKMIITDNYLPHQGEVSYYIDNMSQVVLFNNVSQLKIYSAFDLLKKLRNYLLGCELIHKHGLEFCEISNCKNNEKSICNDMRKTLFSGYDEVDA